MMNCKCVIMGIVFTLTGSIFPGMIIHFVNNGLAILLRYIYELVGEEYMNEHFSFLRFDFSSTTNTIVTIIAAIVGLVIIRHGEATLIADDKIYYDKKYIVDRYK